MNRTTLTTIATATHPRRIHLIILRLSVKYGYMEIMMRAVIAFQLTIGKRENPFRSLLKRVFFFLKQYLSVLQASRLLSNSVPIYFENAAIYRFVFRRSKFARVIYRETRRNNRLNPFILPVIPLFNRFNIISRKITYC